MPPARRSVAAVFRVWWNTKRLTGGAAGTRVMRTRPFRSALVPFTQCESREPPASRRAPLLVRQAGCRWTLHGVRGAAPRLPRVALVRPAAPRHAARRCGMRLRRRPARPHAVRLRRHDRAQGVRRSSSARRTVASRAPPECRRPSVNETCWGLEDSPRLRLAPTIAQPPCEARGGAQRERLAAVALRNLG